MFPRSLTEKEKEYLFYILPHDKPGYSEYRALINKMVIIGCGMFGDTNKILGMPGDDVDFDIPSSPVFALGTIYEPGKIIDVLIHELSEKQIEFDISEKRDSSNSESESWSYSHWKSGDKSPNDNSEVREVKFEDKHLLAISPANKKIWLNDAESGVNIIIPVTNFYSYLMTIKNIRESQIVLKPDLFFANQNKFTDVELISAFILYNKYFNRVKLKEDLTTVIQNQKTKKKFIELFNRGKN
ncbi:MAG: hypothetical protein K8H86_01950 [Ignavibacteriaceae bacterium]|nr:hypothetical protein [Ignavibacteriaceae bacterium]